jgi:hypothetical protein
MTADLADGILAVWNDCRPGAEAEYEAWYQGEHLPERLAIPGFLTGRRYRSLLDRSPGYFTYYETLSPDVMTSAPYLARVAAPTPLTRHIMSGIFLNMTRAICRRVDRAGAVTGPVVVTASWLTADPTTARASAADWLSRLAAAGAVGCARWETDRARQGPSTEELIRGRDRTVAGCVVVFFDDAARAIAAVEHVTSELSGTGIGAECGCYKLMAEPQAAASR